MTYKENDVNQSSYYNEQQIIKVWDVYVKNLSLKYLLRDGSTRESLFHYNNFMSISSQAGILVTENGQLHTNNEKSISICGAVDQLILNNYNGMTNDLEVALEQIGTNKDTIASTHVVIFPYHITAAHWVLGTLELSFDEVNKNIKAAKLHIYNTLEHGGDKVQEKVKQEIENLINKQFKSSITLESTGNITHQQKDGASCGVISAENGKHIINDDINEQIKNQYEEGALELRLQHLNEVKNARFAEMQKKDEQWYNPKLILNQEDIELLITALDTAIEDKNKFVQNNVDTIKFGKDEIKPLDTALAQNKDLHDLLFKSQSDEYKDNSVDTLHAALQYLNKLYSWQGEDKSDKDKNNVGMIRSGRKSQLAEKEHKSLAENLLPNLIFTDETQNFPDFITKSSVYVDKSLLIKDVIDLKQHLLLTCPRRWGKSLNLSMLKHFLQPDGDDQNHYNQNGKYDFKGENRSGDGVNESYKGANKYLKYFKGGQVTVDETYNTVKKLEPLNISKKEFTDDRDYLKKQGQHPVIYLDFKSVVGDNEQTIEQNLRNQIAQAFKEHGYLWDDLEKKENDDKLSGRIRETAKKNLKKLKAYYNGENSSEAPIQNSLVFLSKLLYEYFGERKVYILIDEYDRGANKILESDFLKQGDNRDKAKVLIKTIVTKVSEVIEPCAKSDQTHVEKIILTGITNTLLKEGHSALNNIHEKGVLDIDESGGLFAKYFGFSDKELKEQILNKVFFKEFTNKIKSKQNKDSLYNTLYNKLKYWYNGQVIGREEIFTPSSIIHYFNDLYSHKIDTSKTQNEMIFKNYWSKTGFSKILSEISKIGISDELLGKFRNIALIEDGGAVKLDIQKHQNVNIYDLIQQDNTDIDMLTIYILIKSGYISRTLDNEGFKLPAREAQYSFKENVLRYWLSNEVGEKNVQKFINLFLNNIEDETKLKNLLNDVLKNLEYKKETEADFQVIMNAAAILAEMQSSSLTHTCRSEVQSSDMKKIDGLFMPVISHNGNAIIHEYKKSDKNKSDKSKDVLLNNAVWQIFGNKYVKRALDLGGEFLKTITVRGIVFYRDKGTDKKWQVEIKSYTLNKKKAEEIDKLFSKDGKGGDGLRDNSEVLIGKSGGQGAINYARKEFLKKSKFNTLDELIDKTSNIEDSLSPYSQKHAKSTIDKTLSEFKYNGNTLTNKAQEIIESDYNKNVEQYVNSKNIKARLEQLKKDDDKKYFKGIGIKSLGVLADKLNDKLNSDQQKKTNPKQSKNKKGYIQDKYNEDAEDEITYKSEELEAVLKKRLADENIKNVGVLPTYKSYEKYGQTTESYKILSEKIHETLKENDVALLPYAEEDHFIGIMFKKHNNSTAISYMDSDNINEVDYASFIKFKEGFESYLTEQQQIISFQKIEVNQQKYLYNCGIETIENFIGYLKGEDLVNRNISQDKAIEIHKVLRDSETRNNPFLSEGSAKTLEDTMSMFARLGIEKPKKRTWKEFKKMHGIKDDSPYIMKRMLKKSIPDNENLDDIFKKFKGTERSDGMTQREIEENLQMLVSSYKLSSIGDAVISEEVPNLTNVNTEINQWIKGENKKYSAIVKLENEEGHLHAILLQIERVNNIFKIKIIDPLSENESKFTKEIIELENKLSQYSGILYKSYANKQDSEHATCGDTCLIMMQEYLEEEIGLPVQYRAPLFTVLINDYNYFAMNLKLQAQVEYYRSTGIIFETLQKAADSNQVVLGDSSFIDIAERYTLSLLSNDSNYSSESYFNEIDISYNTDLITTNFISEKLRVQIEFANSTGIIFETLQNTIDNNLITSIDLPFLYHNARIQNCNVESSNADIMNLVTNQAMKNIPFISLAITSLYTKEVGVNFEAPRFLHDELLVNSELNNLNSLFLIDS